MRRGFGGSALALVGCAVLICVGSAPAFGQTQDQREVLNALDYEQKIGAQVPPDTMFTNEIGEELTLGSLFGEKPVLLNLVNYECPMLCTLVLNGALKALRVMSLGVNEDFDVVTISINPNEKPEMAARKKGYYLKKYNREGAAGGWHFLTGTKDAIDAVASTVGFKYTYLEDKKQFAHAAGMVFLTPKGVVSRYLFGIEYAPTSMRMALVEASRNKLGNAIDKLLLYCYQYDPRTGQYGLLIMNVLRLAGLFTVFFLAVALLLMLRNERKLRPANEDEGCVTVQEEV